MLHMIIEQTHQYPMRKERDELFRLYQEIRVGEGWFGKEVAEDCMREDEKAL